MSMDRITFYCELCDKKFRNGNVFSQDIHIRNLHLGKIVGDAVKQYTKVVFEDMK